VSDAPAGSVSDRDRHPAPRFHEGWLFWGGSCRITSLYIPGAFLFPRNLSSDLADIKRAEQDGTFFLVLVYAEMLTEGCFPLHEYPTIPC